MRQPSSLLDSPQRLLECYMPESANTMLTTVETWKGIILHLESPSKMDKGNRFLTGFFLLLI